MAFNPPIGPGTSISELAPAPAASRTFDIARGTYVVTYNPVDVNNPGVLYLYNSSDVVVLDMPQGGSYGLTVAADGTGFYFKGTRGARNASVIEPTIVY